MRASVSAKQLKGQCFGHLMGRADSLEKALMLEEIEGRRRGRQWMRLLNSIIESVDMSLSKFQEMVKDREALNAAVHGVELDMTWQLNSSNSWPPNWMQ